MTNLFKLVILTTVSLTVVILSAFVYFGIQRRRHLKQQQKVDAYIQTHQEMWYDYLVTGSPLPEAFAFKQPHQLLAIETVLFSYMRHVADEQIRQRVTEFASRHFQDLYRKRLKSRRWNVRMNTLYRVGTFGMVDLLPELQRMMKRPQSSEEYFRILTLYSHYLPDEFFSEFYKVQKKFNQYQLKKLFSVMTPQTRSRLLQSFQLLSRKGQYATIELLGKMREYTSLSFLMALLNHPDSEIRIRALKAIYELDMLVQVDRIKPLVRSEAWQERLMVARVLDTVPIDQVKAIYLNLIRDTNWWVRNEAARVLSQTRAGKQVLKQIVAEATDPFAVDASQKYLLKGGLKNGH